MQSLTRFPIVRALVVGDVMLDQYWHGKALRISPEAPVPVVAVEREEARPGGAANVALNARALGLRTALIGMIGDDHAGRTLVDLLASRGVDACLHPTHGAQTIRKLRVLSRHQQLIRLDFEDANIQWDPDLIEKVFERQVAQSQVLILSDYAKGMVTAANRLVQRAADLGLPVVIDPKGVDFEQYRGATVVTPNLAEFEAVVGACRDESSLVAAARALCRKFDLASVLVTRSEKGMTLVPRHGAPLHLPARAREVFDVTGAGDTVVATLGAALAAGMPLSDAAALSNIAAGIVVGKSGTACVSPEELTDAVNHSHRGGPRGILDEDNLRSAMIEARQRGERIVMTNGCFDLLHPGHIDYLERARALGDRLVVAVNDDASVRRLKGAERPVNTLAVRMRMLAALGCVDWVVSFVEDTPERLYRELLPDVLVKGGDYREDQIAGATAVRAAGGEVRVLEFVEGYSTTRLIGKIRDHAA